MTAETLSPELLDKMDAYCRSGKGRCASLLVARFEAVADDGLGRLLTQDLVHRRRSGWCVRQHSGPPFAWSLT